MFLFYHRAEKKSTKTIAGMIRKVEKVTNEQGKCAFEQKAAPPLAGWRRKKEDFCLFYMRIMVRDQLMSSIPFCGKPIQMGAKRRIIYI